MYYKRCTNCSSTYEENYIGQTCKFCDGVLALVSPLSKGRQAFDALDANAKILALHDSIKRDREEKMIDETEKRKNMRAEIYTSLIIGVSATLSAIVKQNGRYFTPEEKDDMSLKLKESLFREFEPYFTEAFVTRPDAISIINKVVDIELSKY